ncbi:hypothetical protein JHK85_002531 [Glycine max]|nr:hypothetical protein JHK85_002531 [Glycine max]
MRPTLHRVVDVKLLALATSEYENYYSRTVVLEVSKLALIFVVKWLFRAAIAPRVWYSAPTDSSVRLGQTLTLKSFENSWIGTKVGVSPCSLNLRPVVSVSRRRPLAATVSFSLPTAKPERASTGQEIPK